jgi:hypothetical protein
MDIQTYQKYCESFFLEENLDNEEKMIQQIAHLNSQEFSNWTINIFQKYDQRYEYIREMIKNIRKQYDFNPLAENADWDKDPIKEEKFQKTIGEYKDIHLLMAEKYIGNSLIYQQKNKELTEYLSLEMERKKLEVIIDNKTIIAEKVIDVLWSGWECDNYAWLIQEGNEKKVITTNHGAVYVADKNFLIEKIKEYQQAIKETEEMLLELEKN